MDKLNVVRLGKLDYNEALSIQEKVLKLREEDIVNDTLLIVEHPPVITIGRTGKDSNIILPAEMLKSMGVSVYEVDRGGDVTYHGPGQIVGYPIIDLNNHGQDIKQFINNLKEVFIRLLEKEYSISAHGEKKKYTGVWINNEKITAIGVAIKHWVTMHGFAFNVNTNLDHYKWIVPCGITDRGVTSLKQLTGQAQDFDYLIGLVVKYFCEIFNFHPEITTIDELFEQEGADNNVPTEA